MGGAVYGKAGCTCPSPQETQLQYQKKVLALEARLFALELFVYKRGGVDPETDRVMADESPAEAKPSGGNAARERR